MTYVEWVRQKIMEMSEEGAASFIRYHIHLQELKKENLRKSIKEIDDVIASLRELLQEVEERGAESDYGADIVEKYDAGVVEKRKRRRKEVE